MKTTYQKVCSTVLDWLSTLWSTLSICRRKRHTTSIAEVLDWTQVWRTALNIEQENTRKAQSFNKRIIKKRTPQKATQNVKQLQSEIYYKGKKRRFGMLWEQWHAFVLVATRDDHALTIEFAKTRLACAGVASFRTAIKARPQTPPSAVTILCSPASLGSNCSKGQ